MKSIDLAPRRHVACAVLALAGTLALAAAPAQAAPGNGNGTATRAQQDRAHALVQLAGEPLATAATTKPAHGRKIDFDSIAVKSYRAQLAALRNDYKAWLRANVPGAKVTGEFDTALNAVAVQLNGASLAQISATPMVSTAEYQGVYYPNDTDPDLALIDAPQAWGAGGAAGAGAGVKVAIVDAGIDITHPCFSDAGYVQQQRKYGDPKLTNNKVIAARVFNNKLNQNGFDATAIGDHGTHVAGTVACNFDTPATVSGVAIPHGISGVAPHALLGSYNVFPGDVENARSEDILNALEAAYRDGFDVANMSLGGGSHGVQDLLTRAVDNLDRANMVVAVAAGNSGPGRYTVESPGMAARALTAGASTVGHYIAAPVAVGGVTYGAASGDFATVASDLTRPLAVLAGTTNGLDTACAPLAVDLTGRIALLSRGTCNFSVKIRHAQNAGAAAVLVANNVAGDPTAMASDGTPDQPTIPAYMVAKSTGQTLAAQNGAATTIGAQLSYLKTGNDDIMAGFSSQGPTDVDLRVKPDVVAPGVNVLSSVPASACAAPPCFAFFSGTSMATPHLAGSAAVVRGQHPGWSAAEVRSAVVNTAEQGVLKSYTTAAPIADLNVVGAGRENLAAAVAAVAALDPVSVSFGAVPSGSGQTQRQMLTLRNLSASARTFDLSIAPMLPIGVGYALDRSTVLLGAGESTTVVVSMTASRGATGEQQAVINVAEGGTVVAHAALYTLMK